MPPLTASLGSILVSHTIIDNVFIVDNIARLDHLGTVSSTMLRAQPELVTLPPSSSLLLTELPGPTTQARHHQKWHQAQPKLVMTSLTMSPQVKMLLAIKIAKSLT
jgi:hypothetical protein